MRDGTSFQCFIKNIFTFIKEHVTFKFSSFCLNSNYNSWLLKSIESIAVEIVLLLYYQDLDDAVKHKLFWKYRVIYFRISFFWWQASAEIYLRFVFWNVHVWKMVLTICIPNYNIWRKVSNIIENRTIISKLPVFDLLLRQHM